MLRVLRILALAWLAGATAAHAVTPEQARLLAAGDNDERLEVAMQLAAARDPRGPAVLQALADGQLGLTKDERPVIVGERVLDAVTGEPVKVPADEVETATANNRLRRGLEAALAAWDLASPEAATRRKALAALAGVATPALLPLLEQAAAAERDAALRDEIALTIAKVQLAADDPAQRLAAVRALSGTRQSTVRQLLAERLEKDGDAYVEPDAKVRAEVEAALDAIDARIAQIAVVGHVFSGLSLGSILLLAALGLAITYGVMGVINMAHGEMIMIGAYATYFVQTLFRQHAPGALDWYLPAAIPVAFLAAAAVGLVLERTVIRWLYGRPLETLLATWGISLFLIQAVRTVFGAQNVEVANPSWLSGGLELLPGLVLPWSRIAIIAFGFAVLAGVALLIRGTRFGLFMRGVTQNRRMASCVGVRTDRIDALAFAFGSGLAGLAGCALSQIGNVGPDLGQSYIVDSFMVVVLGGVGQLIGTVYAALGLGIVNKFLEAWQGAVIAKIVVLVFIIVFIQKRPQGMFALKGRFADD